jgi:hypothetical protein
MDIEISAQVINDAPPARSTVLQVLRHDIMVSTKNMKRTNPGEFSASTRGEATSTVTFHFLHIRREPIER